MDLITSQNRIIKPAIDKECFCKHCGVKKAEHTNDSHEFSQFRFRGYHAARRGQSTEAHNAGASTEDI
jgi:hypothetical protein